MFKQSNAFFAMIIEGIGRLLAPHKLLWCGVFAIWLVAVIVLRFMGYAPDWLISLWLWSIPFIGVFALMSVFDHFGWFDRLSRKDYAGAIERERAERSEQRLAEQAEQLKNRDKTRPDRR